MGTVLERFVFPSKGLCIFFKPDYVAVLTTAETMIYLKRESQNLTTDNGTGRCTSSFLSPNREPHYILHIHRPGRAHPYPDMGEQKFPPPSFSCPLLKALCCFRICWGGSKEHWASTVFFTKEPSRLRSQLLRVEAKRKIWIQAAMAWPGVWDRMCNGAHPGTEVELDWSQSLSKIVSLQEFRM